jgi:GNAT superfamily N-acetyltransferase
MPLDCSAPAVAYFVEPWSACVGEMRPLWEAHWREVGLDHADVPLDMDESLYERMEADGRLHVLTARRAGALVGYLVAVVQPHLHYRSTLFATFDLYYLAPEERSGWRGVSLFRAAERSLRDRGVQVVHGNTKIHVSPVTGRTLDVGPIFEFLDWCQIERTYRKVLRRRDAWVR